MRFSKGIWLNETSYCFALCEFSFACELVGISYGFYVLVMYIKNRKDTRLDQDTKALFGDEISHISFDSTGCPVEVMSVFVISNPIR